MKLRSDSDTSAGGPVKSRRGFLRDSVGENGPVVWMAPLLAIVTLFYLYPAFEVLRFSVTNATLLEPNLEYTLDTFRRVLAEPVFYDVLRVTLIFVVGSLVLQVVLALLIALAVNRISRRRLPGAVFVRTLVLTAWVMPGVVIGVVWSLVLNEASYGLVNAVLASLGMSGVAFLSDPQNALMSVVVANVWRGTAFSMILQYAGLQSIPEELYEAAAVDGASKLQSFWHITLPQLRPILMINVVLGTIYTLNTFDMILPLTGGGPGRATEVVALRAYNVIFQDYSLAEGAVLAVIMLVMSLSLTLIYRRVLRSEGGL